MSGDPDSDAIAGASHPGIKEMQRLLEEEIARLREELALVRAGDHPQRRTLIVDRVARLDERQDALARLEALITDAGSPT